MKKLAQEMREKNRVLLDEFLRRAENLLQGTLYASLKEQKVLEARYSNVLEVIADYADTGDEEMLVQHFLIIFMQRYYVDIDENNPLTSSIVRQRVSEIQKSSRMGIEICLEVLSTEHRADLTKIYGRMVEVVIQMGDYLNRNIAKLATRLPVVRLRDIDYDPETVFDIEPAKWPYR
jgi:hypothetical protein